jgi:Beta-glucosidase/6-phospho-beta-glucosidase/beta-galactosidase
LIHRVRKGLGYDDTKVSFANHMRVFDPADPKNPIHIAAAKATERFFQGSLSKAMYIGEFSWPISNILDIPSGIYCDFIGINYYTRSTVKGIADGIKEGAPINDLGWEIYPEGIVRCAQKAYNILQAPIYITENGTCDNTDSFRSRYIYEHLKQISESDLPFERYYHWCFCDNFEWIEGETARFGIVKINYETQERTVNKSGEFFSEIIKNKGVNEEMYEKYIKEEYKY